MGRLMQQNNTLTQDLIKLRANEKMILGSSVDQQERIRTLEETEKTLRGEVENLKRECRRYESSMAYLNRQID